MLQEYLVENFEGGSVSGFLKMKKVQEVRFLCFFFVYLCGMWWLLLVVDCVGQCFGWNEFGYMFGSDFDCFVGLWVVVGVCGMFGDFQFVDIWQGDFVIVFQGVFDDFGELVECVVNGGFLCVDGFGDVLDQLVFGQCYGGVVFW